MMFRSKESLLHGAVDQARERGALTAAQAASMHFRVYVRLQSRAAEDGRWSALCTLMNDIRVGPRDWRSRDSRRAVRVQKHFGYYDVVCLRTGEVLMAAVSATETAAADWAEGRGHLCARTDEEAAEVRSMFGWAV